MTRMIECSCAGDSPSTHPRRMYQRFHVCTTHTYISYHTCPTNQVRDAEHASAQSVTESLARHNSIRQGLSHPPAGGVQSRTAGGYERQYANGYERDYASGGVPSRTAGGGGEASRDSGSLDIKASHKPQKKTAEDAERRAAAEAALLLHLARYLLYVCVYVYIQIYDVCVCVCVCVCVSIVYLHLYLYL